MSTDRFRRARPRGERSDNKSFIWPRPQPGCHKHRRAERCVGQSGESREPPPAPLRPCPAAPLRTCACGWKSISHINIHPYPKFRGRPESKLGAYETRRGGVAGEARASIGCKRSPRCGGISNHIQHVLHKKCQPGRAIRSLRQIIPRQCHAPRARLQTLSWWTR